MASNDQYIVSARKYRPATFQTVVGQRALTATLKNAILGGKLAQAYLFCGPRGVGKTSCARIFAKTINCLNPTPDGEACGECESCKAIERGNSFNLVELDAASNNSVEDIRNITDQVNIPAQDGRYRVFIIDEVHMLSNNAFNAFLKTLEEPPKNVVFILATTERHKVIPTILSRCQVYDFRRITVNDIIDHLAYVASNEGVEAEREALGVIALKADGAMRDALSIFDQVVASTSGKVTYQGTIEALNVLDQGYYFKLIDIFRAGNVASALLTYKEITDKGFDSQFFINGLAEHIRNLMVCADPRTVGLLETSQEWAQKYTAQAPSLPAEWYYAAMKILNDADFNYRLSGNKRLLVELSLIRLSRLLHASQPASPSPAEVSGRTQGMANRPPQQQPPQSPFVAPEGLHKPQAAPANSHEAQTPQNLRQQEESKETATKSRSYGSDSVGKVKEEFSGVKEPATEIKTKVLPAGGANKMQPKKFTSFRLSENHRSGFKTGDEGPKNSPFTLEELIAVWEEFANANPDQRILVAAMRNASPKQISETEFLVEVEHPAQKQAFESALPQLTDFFKGRLKNDHIILRVEISEKGDGEKKLNPKEFLKMAIEENTELAKFLKAIDAELE
ncbi:MAG: DNA polymerase III subunit gamma/tau [Muribaculaceae bacterium]|nr:DNA polymerase III subunit gamma/tau [Muribaculaceae bacterium]